MAEMKSPVQLRLEARTYDKPTISREAMDERTLAAEIRREQKLHARVAFPAKDSARVAKIRNAVRKELRKNAINDRKALEAAMNDATDRRDEFTQTIIKRAQKAWNHFANVQATRATHEERLMKDAALRTAETAKAVERRDAYLRAVRERAVKDINRVDALLAKREATAEVALAADAKKLREKQKAAGARYNEYLDARIMSATKDIKRVKQLHNNWLDESTAEFKGGATDAEFLARQHEATIRRELFMSERTKMASIDASRAAVVAKLNKEKLAKSSANFAAKLDERQEAVAARHKASLAARTASAKKDIERVDKLHGEWVEHSASEKDAMAM